MTDNSEANITSQIAYGNKQWGLALGYRYGQCGTPFRTGTNYAIGVPYDAFGTPCAVVTGVDADGEAIFERTEASSNSFSFNAFWRPEDSGWIPSISAGIGKSYLNGNSTWDDYTSKRAMASWMVGLTWNDVLMKSNALGYAVGQPQFVYDDEDFVADGGYAMELWYSFQVTDNISVTPSLYWLSRPLGDLTQNYKGDYKSFGVFAGVIQTVFKF